MESKQALETIKQYLEVRGTNFSEYYGSWIYNSGPCPNEFFLMKNEGDYTVYLLIIPSNYLNSLITEDSLLNYLNNRN